MLKKTLLLLTLLCSVLVGAEAETNLLNAKALTSADCTFTPTDPNIALTYGIGSFSTTEVNFAAHYSNGTNPYNQFQWEFGVVIGYIDCYPETYVYGRNTQIDGRVMEVGVTTSGYVIVKWISGPAMPPTLGPISMYFLEMPHVSLSPTGL